MGKPDVLLLWLVLTMKSPEIGLHIVKLDFSDFDGLGIDGRRLVRDLWRQMDVARIDTNKDALSVEIPVHGVLLYKFLKL